MPAACSMTWTPTRIPDTTYRCPTFRRGQRVGLLHGWVTPSLRVFRWSDRDNDGVGRGLGHPRNSRDPASPYRPARQVSWRKISGSALHQWLATTGVGDLHRPSGSAVWSSHLGRRSACGMTVGADRGRRSARPEQRLYSLVLQGHPRRSCPAGYGGGAGRQVNCGVLGKRERRHLLCPAPTCRQAAGDRGEIGVRCVSDIPRAAV